MSYFQRRYDGAERPLGKVIAEVYPELPYALLVKLLRRKDVFVDGVRRREDHVVSRGNTLDLFCTPSAIHLNEIYRTEDVLVLYKPKGVATDGEYSFSSLVAYVYGDNTRVMHRLDTNTDGLLLFALTDRAYAVLLRDMAEHRIVKYYRARVWGKMEACRLEGYLLKDADHAKVRIYDHRVEGAVPVACDVAPLAYEGETTVVNICLKGGKTHQLRAQLSAAGHFILGDSKYGVDAVNRRLGYKRQQLTSYRMEFGESADLGLRGVVVDLPEDLMTI